MFRGVEAWEGSLELGDSDVAREIRRVVVNLYDFQQVIGDGKFIVDPAGTTFFLIPRIMRLITKAFEALDGDGANEANDLLSQLTAMVRGVLAVVGHAGRQRAFNLERTSRLSRHV